MYFSRITLNPVNIDTKRLIQLLHKDNYYEHQVLWNMFASDANAKRDFLFRQSIENSKLTYYVVSERVPLDRSQVFTIDPPKPYDPRLYTGQYLNFSLRANPVIKVTTLDGKKKLHDVVMHEKIQINYKNLPKSQRPKFQQLVQNSCIRWLNQRSSNNGFSISENTIVVEGYRQHTSRRRRTSSIRYSTVDFNGTLTVTDVDKFRSALFFGIGKCKAFGCGLLLIKPVYN